MKVSELEGGLLDVWAAQAWWRSTGDHMKKLAIVFGASMMLFLSPLILLGFVSRVLVHGVIFGWNMAVEVFNFFSGEL